MMWLLLLISALTAERMINLAFVALCLALAVGLSALLYLGLVLI